MACPNLGWPLVPLHGRSALNLTDGSKVPPGLPLLDPALSPAFGTTSCGNSLALFIATMSADNEAEEAHAAGEEVGASEEEELLAVGAGGAAELAEAAAALGLAVAAGSAEPAGVVAEPAGAIGTAEAAGAPGAAEPAGEEGAVGAAALPQPLVQQQQPLRADHVGEARMTFWVGAAWGLVCLLFPELQELEDS